METPGGAINRSSSDWSDLSDCSDGERLRCGRAARIVILENLRILYSAPYTCMYMYCTVQRCIPAAGYACMY